METPSELEDVAGKREEIKITERDYEGENVVAVDFGPTGDEPAVDVIDDTAIVVVGDRQFEFEVPDGATDITVNDGILTITEEK